MSLENSVNYSITTYLFLNGAHNRNGQRGPSLRTNVWAVFMPLRDLTEATNASRAGGVFFFVFFLRAWWTQNLTLSFCGSR